MAKEIQGVGCRDPRIYVELLGVLPHRQKNVEVVARSAFYVSMTVSGGVALSLAETMAVDYGAPITSDIPPNREI